MAFNGPGVLDALTALLGGIAGIQRVYTGAPASIGNQVVAYVATVGQQVTDKAAGLLQRDAQYFVGFAYKVEGAADTAEATIAAALDAFMTSWAANRKLGGLVDSSTLDLSLANAPQYQVTAGQEFRVYPLIVHCTQQQAYSN